MNGTAFKLATLAKGDGNAFVAIVLGDDAIDLEAAHDAFRAAGRKSKLSASGCMLGLLEQWDRNFAVLQEVVAFLEKEGVAKCGAAKLSTFKVLPPVRRPGKMFYAAQNFQEHVNEMIRAGMSPSGGPVFTGEKSTTVPYLFLKAPSCLAGAFDDIAIPRGMTKIDWEAEIALAIGKGGKRIKAEHALDHVAGFMTTNDVSCRDLQIRADRPALRSDWLGGKRPRQFRADGALSRAARLRARSHESVHQAHGQRRGEAGRQYVAIHLHAGGADRICLQHVEPPDRRYFQLRHLRRRRPGHQYFPQSRRHRRNRN